MRSMVKASLCAGVLSVVSAGAIASDAAESRRAYVAGKYELVLDQAGSGFVSSVAGGGATSDVVLEKVGPDHVVHKHLAGVKYEDVSVTCGAGMSKAFYGWIKDTLEEKSPRKNGAIQAMSFDYKEVGHVNFFNALITEVAFPALDAASRDGAQFMVTFAPERTMRAAPSNTQVANHEAGAIQKRWLASNFRFELAGVDATRVSKVEPIIVKQKVVDNPTGELRDAQREPAHVEIPNLVLTVAEAGAQDWYKWHEDFVIKGNNSDAQEKAGAISYLSPDLKTTLFKLTLKHVGIVKVDPETAEAGSENVRRVKVELYVEDLGFDFDNNTAF